MKKLTSVLLITGVLLSLFSFGVSAGTRGDVDNDGGIYAADARLALRRSLELEDFLPGSSAFIAADMNGDGAITAEDARAILRTAVGLSSGIKEIVPEEKPQDAAFNSAFLRFSLELFRRAAEADAEQNVLISPFSVFTALAMEANGAHSATLSQMESALGGLKTAELNAYLHTVMNSLPNSKKSNLKLANSIWVNNRVRRLIEKPFLQRLMAYYDCGVNACDFDRYGIDAINNWVKEKTDGMIDSVLEEPDPYIITVLLNALAFDAKWQHPFEESDVGKREFTRADGKTESCDMMYGTERLYLEDDTATGFVKAYDGGGYRFTALLPEEGADLAAFAASLTPEKLTALYKNAKSDLPVRIGLPKFTFDYSIKLNDTLKAMGITDLFAPNACDLTRMFPAEVEAYVSDVLHKTFIEVNTDGTRAAAVTAIVTKENAFFMDYRTVMLDRPFLFLITMGENDIPVFIGTVNGME